MSHQHLWEDKLADDAKPCVEIDERVCLRPYTRQGVEGPAGYLFAHDTDATPHRCEGALSITPDGRAPVWSASGSLEDGTLTLTPSVLCTIDQFHGFVRDGKWVPA